MKKISSFILKTGRIILIFLLAVFFLGSAGLVLGFYVQPEFLKTEVILEKSGEVAFNETLIFSFSHSVSDSNYFSSIKIYPSEKAKLRWIPEIKKMEIVPLESWRPETRYKIEFPEGRNIFWGKVESREFFFETEKYPRVLAVIPKDGEKDVVIGIEDPIVVEFDKSTRGFFVDFSLDPKEEMIFQHNPEKTRFEILPKTEIKDGEKYNLDIHIKRKDASDKEYLQIYQGGFETLLLAPVVWEKDLSLRLEQAKRYTRAKKDFGKYIDINLDSQVMTIFEDGKLLDSFLVSSGKRGMGTPMGELRIHNKHPRAWSKNYGLFMPFWMAITPDGRYGIHELPEWPGGYKEGANHLGIPVSHGCVRLGVGVAERVYSWAEIGTPVLIY